MRFLVVDNNPTYRDSISKWSESSENYFDVVSDGVEAIEKLDEFSYDFVLCALYMPKMSGYKLHHIITEKYSAIPIIVSDDFNCFGINCPIISRKYEKPTEKYSFIKMIDDIIKRTHKT